MKQRNLDIRAAGSSASSGGGRVIRFVGATETVARDGGVLLLRGWQTEGYSRNPVFLWAHKQDQPPIGRAIAIRKTDEGLEFDVEFPTAEVYPFGELVGRLYEAGFMRAVSVGFRVMRERAPTAKERERGAEWVSEEHELLELSAVPVGADASALKAARMTEDDLVLARSMGLEPLSAEPVEDRAADEVDLMPTAGMKEEAERYRAWKAEGREGGTEVAARRASQILSGDPMPEDAVVAMNAWFARHEVDKQGEGFSPGEPGYPSPGRVAWAAWGGDAGQGWAAEKVAALERGARPYDKTGKKIEDPTPEQVEEYEKDKEREDVESLSDVIAKLDAMLGRLETLFGSEDETPPPEGMPDDAAVDLAGSRPSTETSQRAEQEQNPDPYQLLEKAAAYARARSKRP